MSDDVIPSLDALLRQLDEEDQDNEEDAPRMLLSRWLISEALLRP